MVSKPVTIQVDASQRGLGATLLQNKGPVEYKSKLLTETEKRYSNIEREMLAILHGLEKFHYYAYGRHVVIETDHKPLVAIYKKTLASAPPRIAEVRHRDQVRPRKGHTSSRCLISTQPLPRQHHRGS